MPPSTFDPRDGGWEPEPIGSPRAVKTTCPGCDRPTTLVEKQLVRNLRVLGVPLVSTERGPFVFECPLCGVCVTPEELEALRGDAMEATSVPSQAVFAQDPLGPELERARQELALWSGRVRTAMDRGETVLAQQAEVLAEKARAWVARLEKSVGPRPSRPGSREPTPEKSAEPDIDRALAELRARSRPAAEAAAVDVESDLAALRARLAQPAQASATPATADRAAESSPVPASVQPEPTVTEDDVDALKKRLRPGGGT